jgi:hypothetical protein
MTQVSWVRNFIMAIALVVLASFAYWLEFKHEPEKEKAQEQSKKVFTLNDTQIESMRLDNGKTAYQWECLDLAAKTCKPGDNSKWQLTAPVQVRADDSNANSLISAINNITPSETIDLKDETPEKRSALMKEYDLSPDALQGPNVRKIDVKTNAGESVLYLGGTNPINQNLFAVVERVPSGQKPSGKIDDTKVFQIPGYFKSHFDHDLTYWRDKKVLSFAASEIQSFEIHSKKNGVIQAQRKGDGWSVKSGNTEFVGDIDNIDTFLGASAYLTAKNFVSDSKTDAKAKAALKHEPAVVSISFQKKPVGKETPAPIVLTVYAHPESNDGASKPKKSVHSENERGDATGTAVYATVSNADPLYELESGSIKQLDRELKNFRLSKLITSLERFSIKKLEFSGKPMGDKPLAIVSKDTKWLNAADQSEVNGEKVQSTLDRISGNRIKEFLTGSAIPAGENDGLHVTLGDDQNPAKRQFVFWKKDGSLYARDLNSPQKEAFLVDSSVIEALPWDRNFFKK